MYVDGSRCPHRGSVARVDGERLHEFTVDFYIHAAVLATEISDGETVVAATLAVDFAEAEVVLCAAADPRSLEVSAEPVSNFVDTRLECLVVVDLLIVADVGCLCLVADLLPSLLTLQLIDATAMGWYVDGIGSAETAKVFLLEKVAHTYPSA